MATAAHQVKGAEDGKVPTTEEEVGCGEEEAQGWLILASAHGKEIGVIPKHPLDVKGSRRLNAKYGVLMFHEKGGEKSADKIGAEGSANLKKSAGRYETNWVKTLPKGSSR